jgi:hypothetical protein
VRCGTTLDGEADVAAVSTPVAEKCGVSGMAAAVNDAFKQTDRVEVKNKLSRFSAAAPSPRDFDALRRGAEGGQRNHAMLIKWAWDSKHWHHLHHQ